MNIGILTFHWATNYGAILQAFALQTFLQNQGHTVEIINYKPAKYEISYSRYLKSLKGIIQLVTHFNSIRSLCHKELSLDSFRKKYLCLTKRCYSYSDVQMITSRYDILISGSDQILNPSFTLFGEDRPTPTFYLDFNCTAKKIGYAVSFGCSNYPKDAAIYASNWIKNFDKIGTRESSGLDILNQLGFKGNKSVVPDPTILCGFKMFSDLNLRLVEGDYTYVYMLHGYQLPSDYASLNRQIKYSDTHSDVSMMTSWLEDIGSAQYMITNSYHGMIMAILFHVEFAVLLETTKLSGMNDRFYTILCRLGLENRISDNNTKSINRVLAQDIDWKNVDTQLELYRKIGQNFLKL